MFSLPVEVTRDNKIKISMKSCHCVGNMHFVPMVQAQLGIVQEQADTMIAARCQPPFIIILSVSLRQPSNISPPKKQQSSARGKMSFIFYKM